MSEQRLPMKASIRQRVMDAYDGRCAYCGAPATVIDHVIPYSYVQRHEIKNLVPACQDCNLMVSDKMFESFEDKRAYILERRENHKWTAKRMLRKARCADCGLPFKPGVNGATNLLCHTCARIASMPPEDQAPARKALEADIATASKEAERIKDEALAVEIEKAGAKLEAELAEVERERKEQERIDEAVSERIAARKRAEAELEATIARREAERIRKNNERRAPSPRPSAAPQIVTISQEPAEIDYDCFDMCGCPFCGGNVSFWGQDDGWYFECDTCKAVSIMPFDFDDMDGAVDAWNRRAR